jgi:anaerobic ribonucleoside-triphosphate reductase
LDSARVKDAIRLFILDLSQHVNASLGLELGVPKFIREKAAFGPQGKILGKYEDFAEESRFLALTMLEVLAEEGAGKPLFNPRLIIKLRDETFGDEKAQTILLKAHDMASAKGNLYFANLPEKDGKFPVFSSSGCRLETDVNGDWETDTLRTGCLGCVTVNLPRVAYECEKDKAKFLEILKERVEMATRALEIKYGVLRQYGQGLLPFLMQGANGDQYFRLENCSRIINLAGFKEAIGFLCDEKLDSEKTSGFAEETAQAILTFLNKIGRRYGKRLLPAMLPSFEASERLAQLDIERYGIGKVTFSGTREKPFYSTIRRLDFHEGNLPLESLAVERKLSGLGAGGSLTVIELGTVERKPEELLTLTKLLFENRSAEFFTYNRKITYCSNCRKSGFGLLHKCPSCGSIGTLMNFDRFAAN